MTRSGEALIERVSRVGRGEALAAGLAFAALCAVVLMKSPQLLEPDDYAYRASIVALTQGHLFLTDTDYQALLTRLSSDGGPGILQWVQTASGTWISEKNPGYPFLAAPFQALGLLRLAPLFYGALGCAGLFAGARRWLGPWGGTWAVILFCSSGAALTFAWRSTMPTFTDASLVAGGAGALLWAVLATERTGRRRTAIGLLGFLALEAAVMVRYTNVVVLAVAVLAVLLTFRRAGLPGRAVVCWLGSVAVLVAAVLAFDQLAYGSALTTGYSSGVITFSVGSIVPNLRQLPAYLVVAMPMLLLALGALGWQAVLLGRSGGEGIDPVGRAARRRDAAVGAALGAGWLGLWGLYAAYDWTVDVAAGGGSGVQVIRFYVPAIGLMALLGAWLLSRLPRWLVAIILLALAGLGALSFTSLTSGALGGPGGGPGGGVPGGPGAPPGPPPSAPGR
jgi:hypothetical protein